MAKTIVATPEDLQRLKRRKETETYQPIIEAFAARGIYLERRNAGSMVLKGKNKRGEDTARVLKVGAMGVPDLTGWTTRALFTRDLGRPERPGRYIPSGMTVAIEVKVPNWMPRTVKERVRWAAQMAYLKRVERAHGLAWVVHGPEDAERLIMPDPPPPHSFVLPPRF